MPIRLIESRWRAPAIYGTVFAAAIGLTLALVKLGALRPGLALPVAAFDIGTLGMIIVSFGQPLSRLIFAATASSTMPVSHSGPVRS